MLLTLVHGRHLAFQSKKLGVEWKAVTPEEKATYEAMANKDKQRYKDEIANYTPPKTLSSPSKKKTKKDPNEPSKYDTRKCFLILFWKFHAFGLLTNSLRLFVILERSMSAYMIYSQKNRSKIKESYPDLSFGDIAKKVSEIFKQLPAEEKKKYEDRATEDKVRYQREMKAYKAKKTSTAAESDDSESDSDDSDGSESDSDDSDSSESDSDN